MSTDAVAYYIETFAGYSQAYPLLFCFFILVFMTIESSFIPFPSEAVMIPAGFLAARYEMLTSSHAADLSIVIAVGTLGSLVGAYANYWISSVFGRPFLHKYGKYFLLKESALDRAEELFGKYGDIVTFVCRFLPAIRQLISIPAGLSRMNLAKFSLFTGLGAGMWTAILAGVGYYFGRLAEDMDYKDMLSKGVDMVDEHYLWIIALLIPFVAAYFYARKKIMGDGGSGR